MSCAGLDLKQLCLVYGEHTLTLMKLVLLQRRICFFMAPVHSLTNTILALLSLFPRTKLQKFYEYS